MKERLAGLPVIGTGLRVQGRVKDIEGRYLAGSIALNTFLSIFPLLLSAIAVVGFVSDKNPSFTEDVIDNFGLSGNAADTMRDTIANAQDSKRAASVIGVVGLLWSGLAVMGALSRVVNASWQVQGRGLLDKAVGLIWLVGAGLLFLASFALSALLNFLPGFLAPVNFLTGVAVGFGLFLWTFTSLGNSDPPIRSLVPGAVMAAVGFEILKIVGSVAVPRLVASSSALYGSLGIVFATIAWLLMFGRLIVYSTVLNVVLHEDTYGTLTVEIEVPNIEGAAEPIGTDRSGAVAERVAEPTDSETASSD